MPRIYSTSMLVLTVSIMCAVATPSAAETLRWELRRIGPSDATSDCIGDPKTPICAVETFLGCLTRHQISLCKRVDIDWVSIVWSTATIEYAIISEKRLRAENIPARDRDWMKPGDVAIKVLARNCKVGQTSCPDVAWHGYDLFLEPVSGGFAFTSISGLPFLDDWDE